MSSHSPWQSGHALGIFWGHEFKTCQGELSFAPIGDLDAQRSFLVQPGRSLPYKRNFGNVSGLLTLSFGKLPGKCKIRGSIPNKAGVW